MIICKGSSLEVFDVLAVSVLASRLQRGPRSKDRCAEPTTSCQVRSSSQVRSMYHAWRRSPQDRSLCALTTHVRRHGGGGGGDGGGGDFDGGGDGGGGDGGGGDGGDGEGGGGDVMSCPHAHAHAHAQHAHIRMLHMHKLHVAHAHITCCTCATDVYVHAHAHVVCRIPTLLPARPLPYPASAVCRVPSFRPCRPLCRPGPHTAAAPMPPSMPMPNMLVPNCPWRRRRRRWWRGRRWRRREDKGGGGLGDGGSLPAELGRPLGGSQPLRARAGGGARARGGPCAGARGGEAPSTKCIAGGLPILSRAPWPANRTGVR